MATERKETTWIENWYEITQLPNGVVAIGEPKHQEEVFCYLIKGQTRDVLIDTGMGVTPLADVLEKQRNSTKELVVVNTHWHFDHVGGNPLFEKVLVPKNIDEVAGLLKGWSHEELQKYSFFDGFHDNGDSTMPPNFNSKDFFIPGSKNIEPVLKDGYQIDLGDRVLEIIETPGHTPGGICLFDQTNETLFTGDTLYEGPLYAFDKESSPTQYLLSLNRVKRMLGDQIKSIHPGHNYPENTSEPKLMDDAIKLFKMAKSKEPYDEKSKEFSGAVEYVYPGLSRRPGNGQRRLKVVVNEDYVKWE